MPDLRPYIYRAAAGGRCMPVLKVLMTNACRNNCGYCATRAAADIRRTALRPEELARSFIQMEAAGLVQGLFLSSGIPAEPDRVQTLICDTAAILRRRYRYRGYLHLKIVPGASDAAVEETVRLASRVSVNLEAPSARRLARIAPDKEFAAEVYGTLHRAVREAERRGLRSGVTTQFVAGAAGECDAEILTTTHHLYRRLGLRRTYYSGFRPVGGTPLDSVPPMPAVRQLRLYQADFLIAQYGFEMADLAFGPEGNLDEARDPKAAWAEGHPEAFPVEANAAVREELLRVPGIGPIAADRIIAARHEGRITQARALKAMGVRVGAAAPYLTLAGRRLDLADGQLALPL
jgi:predicted DNA-binding helix-hairpin-helix protein